MIILLPSILLRVLVVSAHIRNLETFSDLVREATTYCGICHEMQFANVPKHVVVVEQMNKQKQKPVSVSREHYASLWSWMNYWTGLQAQLQGPTVRVAQLRAPIWRDQLISSGTFKKKEKKTQTQGDYKEIKISYKRSQNNQRKNGNNSDSP